MSNSGFAPPFSCVLTGCFIRFDSTWWEFFLLRLRSLKYDQTIFGDLCVWVWGCLCFKRYGCIRPTQTNAFYLVDCSQNSHLPCRWHYVTNAVGWLAKTNTTNPPLHQCWEHSPHISVSSIEHDSGDAWSVNFKRPCLQVSKELGRYVPRDWPVGHLQWRLTGAPVSNSAAFHSCFFCDCSASRTSMNSPSLCKHAWFAWSYVMCLHFLIDFSESEEEANAGLLQHLREENR